ncbi:MAG: aromatic ring-hydroxylating dioxygenase subunit alpha [Acidimicrobiia bacterium]
MNRADLIALAKRMLDLIDRKTTDLAPSVMLEPMVMYTSPDVLRQERELIFGRSPMFLGMSGDLPAPGTWKSVDIVDTPYLLCRDADGEVHLYLNSCRHRGVKVVDGAGTSANLRCPFHAWTYDFTGKLIAITEPEAFEGLCREEHGLVSLPVVERYGMIFGAPVPGPPLDADDFLCGLGPELAEWGFETFSLYTERHPHPFRGNWKFAWDTYCENYHFAFLHEKTLEGYLVNRRQAVDFFGPHVRMVSALQSIHELRDQPEEEWDPGRHLSIQYRIYPSVSFTVFPDKNEVHWVFPGDTPFDGEGMHAVYVAEQPEREEDRKALDEAIFFGCEVVVNGEDLWVTGQSELGMRAPAAADHVVFGRNEPAVQHFHNEFRRAIGIDVPSGT